MHVGAHWGSDYLPQAYQVPTLASSTPASQTQAAAFAAAAGPLDDTDAADADFSPLLSAASQGGSAGASSSSSSSDGPVSSLLAPTTLANLLGLQMVDGQVDGGASAAALNLPQINLPSGADPSGQLQDPTLQALQSIGA